MTQEEYLKENNYTVYMHKNKINGKVYIGITKQEPKKRWNNGKGYNEQYFKRAIEKYGFDNFEHLILYENLTQKEAEQKEIELIAYYKSNQRKFGYNIDNGGKTIGTHSEKTKLKISNAHKGKKRSKELTKKLIEINRGNKYRFGSHQTEEAKKKISKANKGNKYCLGRITSDETKKKISIANKGKHYSPNTEFKKGYSNISRMRSVICIETGKIYNSMTSASKETNISFASIQSVCLGKSKTAGKLHWRYYEK
jgi:group I intron endonuclease